MEKELKCSRCGSSQTRYRLKTNDRICYVCGNSEYIKKNEVNNLDGN